MSRRRKNNIHKPSFVPKFSDPDILRSIMQSSIWKSLFMGKKDALWTFLKAIYYLKTEMFISPIRSVLRHSHGRRTMGIFITLMSGLMIIGFNAKTPWGVSANIFPFLAPILPFFMDGEQMKLSAFDSIHSTNLLYFWVGYLVISTLHLWKIYRRKSQNINPSKRGFSWLHGILFKHLKVSEKVVQLIIEPALVTGLGYGLHYYGIDSALGLFLIIAGICIFFQELQDAVIGFTMPS